MSPIDGFLKGIFLPCDLNIMSVAPFMEPKAGWTVTAGLDSCDIGLIRR